MKNTLSLALLLAASLALAACDKKAEENVQAPAAPATETMPSAPAPEVQPSTPAPTPPATAPEEQPAQSQ
ncbi:hypothetical protein D3879_16480 [Pseudomonas cavernicola]|uniref:Lipoprotein n=1 Tax=Pseudomonas cavernicola TaxID=2320866 RepID=A0A418XB33_9PSED|nr:hypothetical protein [Pseudomonas cavernicola]RJG09671.1 hypothetical protein D3879_16480 [Pseudomonas cavernicola]